MITMCPRGDCTQKPIRRPAPDQRVRTWRPSRWALTGQSLASCLPAERVALDEDELAVGDQHGRVQDVPETPEDLRDSGTVS